MAKNDYEIMTKQTAKTENSSPQFNLSPPWQFALALGLIFIVILVCFAPIVFENKVPPSTDVIAWQGNAQSILEAKKEHRYTPLWANNVFSGMPAHLISLRPPFDQPARLVIDGLSKIFKWQAIYYLLGAFGVLSLFKFWKLNIGAGLFAALAFIWWPDLLGKLEAGHNSKVQTIMCIPIVLFLFLRLLKKTDLLNFSLFTIAFSIAVRAGHYQIVFYLALTLAFFGAAKIIKMILDKQLKSACLALAFVLIGLVLGVSMSAFNSLQVREYSKYSIRGGTGEKGSTGLEFDYATQWSLHPGEMYNFIIPRFWGGHSEQIYEGDAVPQLKGRAIPGYWGHMPFTTTTDYLGVVVVFFAVLGIGMGWKRTEVKILFVLLIFSALMAFGRHFPYLYKFFFNIVPYFNKFRVPVMIVVLFMFSNALLGGIGIHEVVTRIRQMNQQKVVRILIGIFSAFFLLGVIPLLLRHSLAFSHPGDAAYGEQFVPLLLAARLDLLRGDTLRMIALVAAAHALVYAFLKSWISKALFISAVVFLLLVDLIPINRRYMKKLIPKTQMDSYFNKTEIDQFLLNDTDLFRIYPLGELSGQAHWSYYHQSIEGYHAAKLRIYQDIHESCLQKGTDPEFQNNPQVPINWNVVNMLNTKYILAKGGIQHPNLEPVTQDPSQKIVVFRNKAVKRRAFCVGKTEVIENRQSRLDRLNQASFQPDSVAIVESPLTKFIEAPSSWSTDITRYEPNYIDVKVMTNAQTLMVLSEIYYPAGWKAFINGQELEILKVNHILRGVVVPTGTHTVEFRLEPKTYKISRAMMGSSIIIVYALLIIGLVSVYRQKQSSHF